MTRKSWIKTLCQASRGYSIYEMDGRYLSPEGPVDERVLVIRFIFHNPSEPADIRTDFLASSLEVVNYLVAHRLAEELGVEEEIWFLEYHQPQLAIWRKDAEPPPARIRRRPNARQPACKAVEQRRAKRLIRIPATDNEQLTTDP